MINFTNRENNFIFVWILLIYSIKILIINIKDKYKNK